MKPEELAERFMENSKVEAVALSGSRTSAINDSDSDYDIYVYSSAHISEDERAAVYASLGLDAQISISFFEEGDEACSGGVPFDIMFRSIEWTENEIKSVYRDQRAKIGYTTCILYNILTSRILADRSGWLDAVRNEISQGYPEKLRERIIRDNLKIINGSFSSPFIRQLELAVKRHDIFSQQHRLTAILVSYFDIIFAYNRVYHPGEKKLVGYAHLLCPSLPESFDDDIEKAIGSVGRDSFLDDVRTLLHHLDSFLHGEGI